MKKLFEKYWRLFAAFIVAGIVVYVGVCLFVSLEPVSDIRNLDSVGGSLDSDAVAATLNNMSEPMNLVVLFVVVVSIVVLGVWYIRKLDSMLQKAIEEKE